MKKLILLLALAPSLVFGQSNAVRWENTTWTTNRIGGIRPIVPIPDAKVQVCNFPANAVPCSNYATTYTDISAGTVCNGTNGCSNPITTDDNGKFGFWVLPGTYQYTYTSANGLNFGPYTVTLGLTGTVVETNHNLLSSTHPDTVPASPPHSGSLVLGNGSNLWQEFLGNTSTTPLCFQEAGNGAVVTSYTWTACGTTATYLHNTSTTVGQRPKLNVIDSSTVTATMTDNPGNNSVDLTLAAVAQPGTPPAPPAPFAIPSGQAVAWAYPNTCSTLASDNGSLYYSWQNDGRASYQCGPTGGVLTRTVSSPLGIPFYEIKWNGFTMPTLPGDAVIQHIYPVFIGVRPSVFGGDLVACVSGVASDTLFSSTTATYGGYYSSSASLGASSSVVTNAYCYVNNGTSTSGTGLDVQTVQLFALAIYYTSATPLPISSSSFFAFPFYPAINGVSPVFVSVADGSPISFNAAFDFIANSYVNLNHTVGTRALNVSNMQNGGNYLLEFVQDATGGAAVTAGSGCTWINPDGSAFSPSIGTGANAHSFIQWHYDGTYCLVTGTGSGGGGMVYPSAGLAASTGSAWRAPAPSDVVNLFTGCSGTQYLGADGNCHAAGTGTVTGTGTTGTVAKWTGSSAIGNAAAADIVNLFSTCSGTQYLGADGACHTAAAGGNTTSTALTTNTLPKANGANSIIDSKLSDDGTTLNYAGMGGMAFSGTFADQGTGYSGGSPVIPVPDTGQHFRFSFNEDTQKIGCTLPGGGDCMPSGSGGATAYAVQHEFVFAVAGSLTFTHNLGAIYPLYSCVTKSGAVWQSNWMTWVDANNVTMTASAASDVVCSFGQNTAVTSLSNPASCPDTSGSGTAQSCTTTPTITVGANSCIAYSTTTANTGAGLTLAVNGGAAAPIAIFSGGSWTTTLSIGIIANNRSMLACFDGTNWDVQTPVTTGGGGGLTPGMVYLGKVTASGAASINVTSLLSSTYDNYFLVFESILPATNGASVSARFSSDNGVTWDSGANYNWSWFFWYQASDAPAFTATDTGLPINDANTSNSATQGGISGTMYLFDVNSGNYKLVKSSMLVGHHNGVNAPIDRELQAQYMSTSIINAVEVFANSGNISGTILVYGLHQ